MSVDRAIHAVITTRAASGSDHEELTRIAFASKRHWGYSDSLIALWHEALTVTPEMIAQLHVEVAQCGTDLLGFSALQSGDEQWTLEALFIDPPHFGNRVGTLLFQRACACSVQAGAQRLVFAADPNAVDFYRKQGAVQIGSVASQPPWRVLPWMVVHLDEPSRESSPMGV